MSFQAAYIEPLYRPPSEADSLILQITNGCSWNQCRFCEMYTAPQKKFHARKEAEVLAEIEQIAASGLKPRRIFLADGDALVLSTRRLLAVLQKIRDCFPGLNRVSSYCLPRNVTHKSAEELQQLQQAGLGLVYVGAESGDDELLARIHKGESFASTVTALQKIRRAGIKTSVMILNGLGGEPYSRAHARHSAALVNETQPEYLATLVVSFPLGQQRFMSSFGEGFRLLEQSGLFREMLEFLSHTELQQTIFRSDHASNYLVLKGVLGRDKQKLINTLQLALDSPAMLNLRQEWQRGL